MRLFNIICAFLVAVPSLTAHATSAQNVRSGPKPNIIYVRLNETIKIAATHDEVASFQFNNKTMKSGCTVFNTSNKPVIWPAGKVLKMYAAYWDSEASWGTPSISISCAGEAIDSDVRENEGTPGYRPVSNRTLAQINAAMNGTITVSTKHLFPTPSKLEQFKTWFWTH